MRFQFTPLREGRLFFSASAIRPFNFNSRPSARGDARCSQLYCEIFISIHAPPRGATLAELVVLAKINYFNSRPSARGDSSWAVKEGLQSYFNSRPSARGDGTMPKEEKSKGIFQFTPLREGRRQPLIWRERRGRFQFTPLREGRPLWLSTVRHGTTYFNSRPSARGD